MTSFLKSGPSKPVAVWLFVVAFLVLAMVAVGGATRLTGSGLSITEWRPVTGALPPMSEAAWTAEFDKYRTIPQYQFVNKGMSLQAFKAIYWWEWGHRLLGRLIGVAFAVPFLAFLVLKRIPPRLIWRCGLLFVLGGLQGFVGWWMVKSGLSERVDVAPERLTAHLGLAMILFALLVWTGLEAWAGQKRPFERLRWPGWSLALLGLVFLQIVLGALVAGGDAGLVYNDWPLMNGAFLPSDYVQGGLVHTLTHSQAAVQFNHRIGAYVLLAVSIWTAAAALRAPDLPRQAKGLAAVLAGSVVLQALLGIATLMAAVPVGLGVAHQATAVVVLGLATAFAWRARRP